MNRLFRSIIIIIISLVASVAVAQTTRFKPSKRYSQRMVTIKQEVKKYRGHRDVTLMLGDSESEYGGNWNQRIPGHCIVNQGIVGDTAPGITYRLDQVAALQPKRIFFECGVNDLSQGLTPDQVAQRVIRLIQQIRKRVPKATLYVESLLPINEHFGNWKLLKGKTNDIPYINSKIRAYCNKQGIHYVDLFSLLKEPHSNTLRREFSIDGLHLSPLGYQKWCNAIKPLLSK